MLMGSFMGVRTTPSGPWINEQETLLSFSRKDVTEQALDFTDSPDKIRSLYHTICTFIDRSNSNHQ